jgi:hypothetical protein
LAELLARYGIRSSGGIAASSASDAQGVWCLPRNPKNLLNVLFGEMTNSRYAPARVMFPTLARVEVRALRKPVP